MCSERSTELKKATNSSHPLLEDLERGGAARHTDLFHTKEYQGI